MDFARARRGDLRAFGRLIGAYESVVYSLALRMLRKPDRAEDMAQEVFMSLNAHIGEIESAAHLLFWLRRVTTNRCIDQLRRGEDLKLIAYDEEYALSTEDDPGDPLLSRHLAALMAGMSGPARAVLILRYQEDLDPTDIAELLDMPLNTVKSHLKRSLELLRQELEPLRSSGMT